MSADSSIEFDQSIFERSTRAIMFKQLLSRAFTLIPVGHEEEVIRQQVEWGIVPMLAERNLFFIRDFHRCSEISIGNTKRKTMPKFTTIT